MVLLNGIKYACERCIRGHRVSACTHTDKTLVMIKPKGRPASQCPHCREQRKIKNAHTSCNCGKKGKSPGQHLASCSCHKNSHCTCVTKEKKHTSTASRKTSSPELPVSDSGEASQSEANYSRSDFPKQVASSSVTASDSDFLIEDIALPFETNQGLLDYFSSPAQLQNGTPEHQYTTHDRLESQSMFDSTQMSHSNSNTSSKLPLQQNSQVQDVGSQFPGMFSPVSDVNQAQPDRDTSYFPNPPTDADLDLMENMFPLFPLVGFNSFESDKSLPLSGLPEEGDRSYQASNIDQMKMGKSSTGPTHSSVGVSYKPENGQAALPRNRSGSTQPINSSIYTSLHIGHPSSVSLTNVSSSTTHHPRPLKPSSSFSVSYQSSRPKRSESVMSAGSTSSNTSKQNLFETSQIGQHNFPKSQSSTAYPPFNLDNSSIDDFQQMNTNSSGLFNENRSLPILSDEEAPRNAQLSGNVTPQSSIPSRQASQTRRKSSLSRTHSQLHHSAVSKEHNLYQVRAGSSVENSPRQMLEKRFASHDDNLTKKTAEIDKQIVEVAEESSGAQIRDNFHDSNLVDIPTPSIVQANDDFNIENPDFSLIPMYSELFE